jgi:hypothetical protein
MYRKDFLPTHWQKKDEAVCDAINETWRPINETYNSL